MAHALSTIRHLVSGPPATLHLVVAAVGTACGAVLRVVTLWAFPGRRISVSRVSDDWLREHEHLSARHHLER